MSPIGPVITPAAIKFGRTYQLMVWGNDSTPAVPDPIYIDFPLTLEFNVTHHIFAEANVGNFSLYNLSASNRGKIFFNRFLKPQPYKITLNAGYVSNQSLGFAGDVSTLPQIFNGYVNVAYTERSGPNLITRINAFDNGDITNGQPAGRIPDPSGVGYTAPPGTSFEEMAQNIAGFLDPTFHTVQFGGVFVTAPPPLPPTFLPNNGALPRTFNGSAWDNLVQLADEAYGAKVFIENGLVWILGQNDVIPAVGTLPILNASSGLLDIPRYDGYNIQVRSIFEPSYKIGQQLILQSSSVNLGTPIAGGWSADCKVIAYTHSGTISGVESGELTTDLTLLKVSTPLGDAS
jgi:hypothetical protein